ncbi:hypothetical protein EV122DRAFT_210353 [Schizophyllum commune]
MADIATINSLADPIDDFSADYEVANANKQLRLMLQSNQVSFQFLNRDPFLLDSEHWNLTTPTVRKAIRYLEALGNILLPHLNLNSPLKPLMIPHVRGIWKHLIDWLDYLHPMHHVGTERMANVPISILACAFFALFSMKEHLYELFRATPRVYQLMFDFWVKVDKYCDYPRALDTEKRLQFALMAVRPALLSQGESAQNPKFSSIPYDTDPVAQKMAFSTTGCQPRRFYRKAFRLADILERSNPPNTLISGQARTTIGSVTNNQFSLLAIMVGNLLPASDFPRDAVLTMVDILKRLVARPRALECAESAAHILWGIWRMASDRRSMMWALKAKAFETIVELTQKRDSRPLKMLRDWLMIQGMYIRVLRALSPRGFGIVSSIPKVSQWYQHRDLMMRLNFDRLCSRYRKCQKEDWPEHQSRCKSIRAVNNDAALREIGPEITPLDIRFQVLTARMLIRNDCKELVKAIRKKENIHSQDYVITINFCELPPEFRLATYKRGARPPNMSDRIQAIISLTHRVSALDPPHKLSAVIEQLGHWLRTGQVCFADLTIDPFLLDDKHWDLRTPTICKGIRCLQALGNMLLPELNEGDAPLQRLVASYVRPLWPSIITWIDYVHPIHRPRRQRRANCPFNALACVFYGLFSINHLLRDLLDKTPRLYQLLFDLWVNLDRYCSLPRALLTERRLSLLFMAIQPALHPDTAPPVWDKAGFKSFEMTGFDEVAKEAILWPVKHRPHLFFQRVMRVLELCVGALLPDADTWTGFGRVFVDQLVLVGDLASRDIPTPSHTRKTVRSAVAILRYLIANVDETDFPEALFSILKAIWKSAEDHRSLLWALRAGAFEMFLAFQTKRQTTFVRDLGIWLMQQGIAHIRYLLRGDFAVAPAYFANIARPNVKKRTGHRTAHGAAPSAPSTQNVTHLPLDSADESHAHAISRLDVCFQVVCARAFLRSNTAKLISDLRAARCRNGFYYDLRVDLTSVPPRLSIIQETTSDNNGAPVLIITAYVPTLSVSLSDGTQKNPPLIAVGTFPVECILRGFVPVDDGWVSPRGEWFGDNWDKSERFGLWDERGRSA